MSMLLEDLTIASCLAHRIFHAATSVHNRVDEFVGEKEMNGSGNDRLIE